MFTKNTVLVLGAGASCHFGYPTGETLIDRIVKTIKKTHFLASATQSLPLYQSHSDFKVLCDYLEFYDPLSIDSFLTEFSNRKDIVVAGKTMIAYEILQAEDPNKLIRTLDKDGKRNENWYRFLHHALTSNVTPQQLLNEDLNVRIITFNYDNSLEHSLFTRFDKSPLLGNDSAQFLQKVSKNILHIYGQVGKFQWKGGNDRSNNDYGSFKDNKALTKAEESWKNTIYVIGDDRNKQVEENANTGIEWLRNAEVVFFLGFGFNDDNVNLLKLETSTTNAKKIFCTNYENSKIISEKIHWLFYREVRIPIISTKDVYKVLSGDFNLLA